MSLIPVLKRFDIYVYKDLDPGVDNTQVPAVATIDFYGEGAWVKVGDSIPAGEQRPVTVWHPGSLGDPVVGVASHRVQLGTDATKTLKVASVTPSSVDATAVVELENDVYGFTIDVVVGVRLIRITDRPEVYFDPMGLVSEDTSTLATDPVPPGGTPTGRARCYLREYRYDHIINISGTSESRLFVDADGSLVMRSSQ